MLSGFLRLIFGPGAFPQPPEPKPTPYEVAMNAPYKLEPPQGKAQPLNPLENNHGISEHRDQ